MLSDTYNSKFSANKHYSLLAIGADLHYYNTHEDERTTLSTISEGTKPISDADHAPFR